MLGHLTGDLDTTDDHVDDLALTFVVFHDKEAGAR
jgi:hypothetical protein